MILISFQMFHPAFFDKFDDPTRIEINAKTDTAAILAQMFDGQTQPTGTRRAEHEPIGPLGEIFVRQRITKHFVIDAEIVLDDAAFGNAGGAAGLENISWSILKRFGYPTAYRPAPQPFVLEEAKQFQIIEGLHILKRIKLKRFGAFQPERRAGFGVKVPLNNFTHMSIKTFTSLTDLISASRHGRFLNLRFHCSDALPKATLRRNVTTQ